MDNNVLEEFLFNRIQLIDIEGKLLSDKNRIMRVNNKKYLEIDVEHIDQLNEAIKILKDNEVSLQGKTFMIGVTNNAYLSKGQCENLFKIREELYSLGCDLKIRDGDFWEIEDVVYANSNLDKAIEEIKKATVLENGNNRPLNEMEKFLMAYRFVSNRRYKKNNDNLESPRHITSIFKTGDVVCVGFATLLKEMCNRLGIECYINSCQVENVANNTSYGHANNVVIIEGTPYYCDACWDCLQNDDDKHFNYCMLPLDDIEQINGCKITDFTAPFINANNDKMEILKVLQEIKTNTLTEVDYLNIVNAEYFKKYEAIVSKKINKNTQFNIFSTNLKEDVTLYLQEMLNILQEIKKSKAITLQQFEQALTNIYKANGNNEELAQQKSSEVIQSNAYRASQQFTQFATNCFSQEYYKSLEL